MLQINFYVTKKLCKGGIIIKRVLNLNIEQMKLMSDRQKVEIINCFDQGKAMTVREMSEKLNLPYSRVNYHIKAMEKSELLIVVDTKVKSGIIEKHYLPAAKVFRIDRIFTLSENNSRKVAIQKHTKRYYNNFFKTLAEDYKGFIEEVTPSSSNMASIFSSIIFLTDEKADVVKEEISAYIQDIIYKHGNAAAGLTAYNIGSFLLPKMKKEVAIGGKDNVV